MPCAGCSDTATKCNLCIGDKYLSGTGSSITCVDECPSQYYKTQTVNGTKLCSICSTTCDNCRDFSYCLSCRSNKLLSNGLCIN